MWIKPNSLFMTKRISGRLFAFSRKMSGEGDLENEAILSVVNGKGLIKLNRPKSLNSLNLNMVNRILPVLNEWNDSGKVSMVIIESEGEKSFCAGGDIVSLTSTPPEKRGLPEQTKFFHREYELNYLIGTLKIPYVALIDGITMGGGVGLSVHGKYRVATQRTMFAMPETGIGLFPDVGGSHFLPRLSGHLGMYLGLVGYRLKSSDCFHAGVATHMCDGEKIQDLKSDLLDLGDPAQVDKVLDKYHSKFELKEFSLTPNLEKIERFFSRDSLEDIFNALGENPEDQFANKSLEVLKKCSPTSLNITYRQIQEGGKLRNLKECLEMEYRMVVRCSEGHDFYEGVRALLIDKDNSPQWNPSSIDGVSEDLVNAYFSPLPDGKELKL